MIGPSNPGDSLPFSLLPGEIPVSELWGIRLPSILLQWRGVKTKRAIHEYLVDCRSRGLSPKSISAYSWALAYLEKATTNLPKKGRELRETIGAPNLSQGARRDLAKFLETFFNWCGREYRHPNPFSEITPIPRAKTLPRILTAVEIDALWEACETQREQAQVALVLDNGIRVGEVANLRWPDVGPDYLVVRGKVGDRQVPLSPEVKRLILGLGDGFHLWMGHKGPMTYSGLQNSYRLLMARAGLFSRQNGAHTLRHTFATRYLMNGGNVRILQEILGHTSLATTMIYVHLAARDVKADHAKHSPSQGLDIRSKLF